MYLCSIEKSQKAETVRLADPTGVHHYIPLFQVSGVLTEYKGLQRLKLLLAFILERYSSQFWQKARISYYYYRYTRINGYRKAPSTTLSACCFQIENLVTVGDTFGRQDQRM